MPTWILADFSAKTHHFMEGPYARVPKELGCAFTASLLVSPLVSIIDKAIVQEITGTFSAEIGGTGAGQFHVLNVSSTASIWPVPPRTTCL